MCYLLLGLHRSSRPCIYRPFLDWKLHRLYTILLSQSLGYFEVLLRHLITLTTVPVLVTFRKTNGSYLRTTVDSGQRRCHSFSWSNGFMKSWRSHSAPSKHSFQQPTAMLRLHSAPGHWQLESSASPAHNTPKHTGRLHASSTSSSLIL